MIRPRTVGMIEKTAKNFPDVKATVEMPNGALHTINGNNEAVAPVAGASGALQTDNIFVAINEWRGDDLYTNRNIQVGEFVNSFSLKAWDQQHLVVDEASIIYVDGMTYDTVTTDGTTVFVPYTNMKMSNATTTLDADNYHIHFVAIDKINLNGRNGLIVRIDVV